MLNIQKFKKSEKGNALFLILIAVALFAALSYAITQSGRGGGGVDREQALIAASQITQYAAGLRTTVTRMIITGTSAASLDFDPSDNQGGSPTDTVDSDDVFMNDGGGAIQQDPPSTAGTSTSYDYLQPTSATNGHYIEGVGSDAADTIVIAEGLSGTVCQEINRGLGLTPEPADETAAVDPDTAGAKAGTTTFDSNDGEAFACVDNTGADTVFIYYHALVEN